MRYLLARGRERIAILESRLEDVQQTLTELKEIDSLIVAHLREHGVPVDPIEPPADPAHESTKATPHGDTQ